MDEKTEQSPAQNDAGIDWHSAIAGAFYGEFVDYLDCLEFKVEYPLTTKPLRIDIIILKKKDKFIVIDKNIGEILKGVNIIEYKSPDDYISIDDYYKTLAYTYLYMSQEKVSIDDVSVTLVGMRHPRTLLRHLKKERGYVITNEKPGIHQFLEAGIIPVQIIESRKLPEDENIFLSSLRSNIKSETFARC